MSSFTHPQVVSNLYEFLSSHECKRYILKNVHQLYVYRNSSKYRLLCSAEEINSNRFETT